MLSPETLEWLRQTARQGHSYLLAHLDHVERTDALRESLETALKRITALELRLTPGAVELAAEADKPDDEPQTLHSVALKMVDTLAQLGVLPEILDTLRRAIREPMAPAAAAAPVATDDELSHCFGQGVRSAFDLNPEAFDGEMGEAALRAVYDHGRAHGTPPAVVEALQEAEAALSGAALASSQALNALPAIRAALQLLGQPAPAAAPEPIEPEAQPAEDAAPAGGLVEQITNLLGHHGDGTSRAAIREVAAWLDRRGNRGSASELREEAARQEERANG